MVLELDKELGLHPERPRLRFESSWFPGGEPHIRILDRPAPGTPVLITQRINAFNDLGMLLVALDALHRMGVRSIQLFLPYFPGARQDRVMTPGEALTCKVYAQLVNALHLDEVIVLDPHSDVTPAVLDRCTVVTNHVFIQRVLALLPEPPLLVSPDNGALKKVHALAKALGGADVVECSKSRDVRTGHLSGFTVRAEALRGRSCLIVDDICDGGGTFIGLAEELRKKGAGTIHLAVSHGLFSKGTAPLTAVFDRLFTTDSIRSAPEAGVTRIPLHSFLNL